MRIIAGQLRGRKLKAPSGMHTRPTLDRVREALFSILGNLRDLRVIDAYAGTGALGIEALSRGAAHASFVENDSAASAVLRDNLETLGVSDRATLIQSSMEKTQQRLAQMPPLDLVLADPPWAIAQKAATTIFSVTRGALTPDARLIIGHSATEPLDIPTDAGFELGQSRRWGGSGLSFFKPISKS